MSAGEGKPPTGTIANQSLTPAAHRRATAEQLAEWDRRIRSDDPRERGAGCWPSTPGAPDAPLHEFALWDLLVERDYAYGRCVCFEKDRLRLVRVIENPRGAAQRIQAKPAWGKHALDWGACCGEDEFDVRHYYYPNRYRTKTRATARSLLKGFLLLAASYSATVVELEDWAGRTLMFDVEMMGPTPDSAITSVLRFVLWGSLAVIIGAQLPANLPFVVADERVKGRPISRSADSVLEGAAVHTGAHEGGA